MRHSHSAGPGASAVLVRDPDRGQLGRFPRAVIHHRPPPTRADGRGAEWLRVGLGLNGGFAVRLGPLSCVEADRRPQTADRLLAACGLRHAACGLRRMADGGWAPTRLWLGRWLAARGGPSRRAAEPSSFAAAPASPGTGRRRRTRARQHGGMGAAGLGRGFPRKEGGARRRRWSYRLRPELQRPEEASTRSAAASRSQ